MNQLTLFDEIENIKKNDDEYIGYDNTIYPKRMTDIEQLMKNNKSVKIFCFESCTYLAIKYY